MLLKCLEKLKSGISHKMKIFDFSFLMASPKHPINYDLYANDDYNNRP